MRRGMLAAIIGMGLALGPGDVWAQDPVHKVGRGLANVLTGWVEVPKNFSLGMQEENPVLGAAWGLCKGIGLTATRMLVGVYEAVTFPVPFPRGYASPYEHLELPDYPWE